MVTLALVKHRKMKNITLFCFIFSVICFYGTAQTENKYINENKIESLNQLEVKKDAYHFYVIGDWGRNGYYKQKELANTMHQAGFVIEPEIIISTGDNFYPDGIASVNDPYLKSSFEDIYSGANLFCPWYVVLGNHDYRGNAQAEIDYTNVSQRWNMPSRYFTLYKKSDDDAKIQFLFLDTSPFEDKYYTEEKYVNVKTQDSLQQKQWIETMLKKDHSDWKIVIAHHPMYTSGKRKNKPSYARNHLESLLEKYNVNAYFAGHEHDLQYHKLPHKNIHHFVSGAGSEVRPTGYLPYTLFAKSVQGFMIVSIDKQEMLVQVVNYKGEVIYKTKIPNH